MFVERIKEIKSNTELEVVSMNDAPEVVCINNFFSPLDITYLLNIIPQFTDSISDNQLESYRLSPYIQDVVKSTCLNVAKITGHSLQNLNYINMYEIESGNSMAIKGFRLPKIQESTVATSPNGNIEAIGVLALTKTPLKLCGVPITAEAGTLSLVKTVDVDPEVCNNTTLECYTSEEDVCFVTFKFTENPRELIYET